MEAVHKQMPPETPTVPESNQRPWLESDMPNHAVTSQRAGSGAVSAVRSSPRRKVSGASILAAAVPTTADARCVGCAVGAGERPADAPPGYVYYPAYGEPLPGPNCYWFRMPVYDTYGNMVG